MNTLDLPDLASLATRLRAPLFLAGPLRRAGERFDLVVRLPRGEASVPVVVVGARIASSAALPAGVFVSPADPSHPVLRLAQQAAETQEQQRAFLRLPARVAFQTWTEARSELRDLVEPGGAVLLVGVSCERGDRLRLSAVVGDVTVLNVDVIVRRVHIQDDVTGVVAVAADEEARAAVASFCSRAPAMPEVGGAAKGRRVLLVDDDADVREAGATWLEQQGFVVDVARDGAEAQEKLQQQQPDALVLDLMMPDMSGWELCTWLRERLERPPAVVVWTASGVTRGLEGVAVVWKGDDPRRLLAALG